MRSRARWGDGMNLIKQFAEHIEFLGFGTVANEDHAGDIFWAWMPDTPDDCICIYSSDSAYAGADHGARVQMMVRGRTPASAYERSQAIVEALAEYEGYLAGDGARVYIDVVNASVGLGGDARKREVFSSNFRVYYCDT